MTELDISRISVRGEQTKVIFALLANVLEIDVNVSSCSAHIN